MLFVCFSQEPLSPEHWESPRSLVLCLGSFFECHILHVFRYWPIRTSREWKRTDSWTYIPASWDPVVWALSGSHSTPEAQCIYHRQLRWAPGLLHKDQHGGRVISYSWTRRQVWLIQVCAASSVFQDMGKRVMAIFFAHTIHMFALGSKDGFGIPDPYLGRTLLHLRGWGIGPRYGYTSVNSTQSLRTPPTPYMLAVCLYCLRISGIVYSSRSVLSWGSTSCSFSSLKSLTLSISLHVTKM